MLPIALPIPSLCEFASNFDSYSVSQENVFSTYRPHYSSLSSAFCCAVKSRVRLVRSVWLFRRDETVTMSSGLPSVTRFGFRRSAPGTFFFPSALNCHQPAIGKLWTSFKYSYLQFASVQNRIILMNSRDARALCANIPTGSPEEIQSGNFTIPPNIPSYGGAAREQGNLYDFRRQASSPPEKRRRSSSLTESQPQVHCMQAHVFYSARNCESRAVRVSTDFSQNLYREFLKKLKSKSFYPAVCDGAKNGARAGSQGHGCTR